MENTYLDFGCSRCLSDSDRLQLKSSRGEWTLTEILLSLFLFTERHTVEACTLISTSRMHTVGTHVRSKWYRWHSEASSVSEYRNDLFADDLAQSS